MVGPSQAMHSPGIVNAEGLDKVRHLVGGVDNEWGPTRLKVAGTREIEVTEAPNLRRLPHRGLGVALLQLFLGCFGALSSTHAPPSPRRGPGPCHVFPLVRGICCSRCI